MANKLLTINYDVDELVNKYHSAIKRENIYEAMLMYNRLKDFNLPEINLRQASVYSMLHSHANEANFLLKCVDDVGFYGYNPQAVLMRLSVFFHVYCMIDVFDFYKAILKAKHPEDERLAKSLNPNIQEVKRGFHFVEDEGKYLYSDAINLMGEGKPEKAIEVLDKISIEDQSYSKAQNFKSVIYLTMGEVEKSKEIVLNQLEAQNCDMDIVNNIYRFTGFSAEEKKKVLTALDSMREGNEYEIATIKATLYMEEGSFLDAISELESITGYLAYTEGYLKQLSTCYLRLNKREELTKILKQLITIYPKNVGARCLLLKIEAGEPNLDERWIYGILNKSMRKEIKKIIGNELSGTKSFDGVSGEQAEFVFNSVFECNDYALVKRTTKFLLDSRYKFLVQDALLSVETRSEMRQLIFQAIIEKQSTDEWTFLINGRLETFKVDLPLLFKRADIKDKEKFEYLLTVYAQLYSLLYYADLDCTNLDKMVGNLFELLYNLPIDKDYPLLTDAHNLVYVLLKFVAPDEDIFDYSFKDLPLLQKEQLGQILSKLKEMLI